MGDTLGLRQDEIDWLRKNATKPTAAALIRQYQMVCDCPSDPGARGIFAGMLHDWRASRPASGNGG